jgi:transcriptional regulator with XRE-family HTH domain
MIMPESNPAPGLFDRLRSIRESKGLSLEKIAHDSRIHIKYLVALEQGQLSGMPAVYEQLFFKAYLKALGVEEELFLEEYLQLHRPVKEQNAAPVMTIPEQKKFPGLNLNYRNLLKSKNLYVLTPFLVVVIILVFLLSNTRNVDMESSEPVKEIDIQSIAASMEPPVETDTVDTTGIEEKKLKLMIQGLRTTWFRLVLDKRDTSEYTLRRGNQMEVQASTSFELVIGRADGLQFKINEKAPQVVSSDSSVVSYLLIDSTGIVVKRIKQPKLELVLPADSTNTVP